MSDRPPLRQEPPAPRESWWAKNQQPEQRAKWMADADERGKAMNAVTTTHHVMRREGDK